MVISISFYRGTFFEKNIFPIKVYDLSITTVTLYEFGLMDSGVLRLQIGRKCKQ